MAGIAPLGGSPATTTPQQVQGAGATVPGPITPAPAPPPKPPDATTFTAFPSSYAGFGTNGTAYGTPGVVNGKLSIVAAPPPTGSVTDAAVQTPPVVQTPPPKAPSPPPPPAPANDATAAADATRTPAAGATASQPVTLQKTDSTDQKVANENNTLDSVGNASRQTDTAQSSGSAPAAPESKPAPPPTAGLLGS